MPGSGVRGALLCALFGLLVASCTEASGPVAGLERSADAATPTSALAAESDAVTTTTTSTPAPTTTMGPTTTRPPIERVVVDTGHTPYATAEGVPLHHPVAVIERIGFHQSGHDGARQQDAAARAARSFVMEGRDRGTGDRTAADIVVEPDREIRAPATGTVVRGGGYTLYCDHRDEYLVIEPDGHPGWEVKVLHFEGLRVTTGDRVEAGVTVVADRGRVLPFESQVDEFTATPAWPHVHVEVVDTSIPDRPSPGGGCS